MMKLTLGFDVYGTLIDTHGVVVELEKMIGADAADFSRIWREKQLEYTFRRSVMGRYENFAVCTAEALTYTIQFMQCKFTDREIQTLLAAYATLPAFAEVKSSLELIRKAGHKMYAFSNGVGKGIESVLQNAAIRDYFDGIVTVDDIGVFKPAAQTYHHFLNTTGASTEHAWLISSNGFDVIGALTVGMQAAWIQRSTAVVFDPWDGYTPTVTLDTLAKLPQTLNG